MDRQAVEDWPRPSDGRPRTVSADHKRPLVAFVLVVVLCVVVIATARAGPRHRRQSLAVADPIVGASVDGATIVKAPAEPAEAAPQVTEQVPPATSPSSPAPVVPSSPATGAAR